MKITKDLQNYLGVLSVLIQKDSKDLLCYFERFNDDELTFQIASPMNFVKNELVSLQFNFKDSTENVIVPVIDFGENFIKVKLDSTSLPNIAKLQKQLNQMILNDEKYGRRKEPRIKLGLSDYKNFSLATKAQVVFSKTFSFMQPCILQDVSMHGVCFITPYINVINKIDTYKIKISFENPISSVIIDAHKVHANIKMDNNKKYAIISCQLLEPIHFVWKEKIISMLN